MKKYAQGEGPVEVFRGKEAEIVNEHLSKTGKSIADFDENERKALHQELDAVRPKEEVSDVEAEKVLVKTKSVSADKSE